MKAQFVPFLGATNTHIRELAERNRIIATAVALGGIVYAFIEAPAQGWRAPAVPVALLAGIAAGVAFVIVCSSRWPLASRAVAAESRSNAAKPSICRRGARRSCDTE